jgi:hypothetical protein
LREFGVAGARVRQVLVQLLEALLERILLDVGELGGERQLLISLGVDADLLRRLAGLVGGLGRGLSRRRRSRR